MNKKMCDSSKNNEVSLKASNTIKIRKTSASDILTDQVPVKKQRVKPVNENANGENVKSQHKRIIKRRLASTSDVDKTQETCEVQNKNMKAIRKPLTEVSNNLIFQQIANKKTDIHFSEQLTKPIPSVSKILTSENVCQSTSRVSRFFNSLKLENEKHEVELKQMKDSATTDKKHESKQMKNIAITNEYLKNKCKQAQRNDRSFTEGGFCSSLLIYNDDIIEYLFLREASMNECTGQVKHMANFHKIFQILANHLIKLQECFDSFCTTIFLTAKIFELYTSTVTIEPNCALVVMLASYWIASKYNDCGAGLRSSELTSIASIKQAELIHFERDILSALGFNVSFPEPLAFSEYYIFHLNVRNATVITHCANYMIHCLLLSRWYFSYKSSKIAAAAVRLTLRYFKSMDEDCVNKCWKKLHGRPAYYDASELVDVEEEIMSAVGAMQDPDFKYRQAFKKFSQSKYMSVSEKLREIIG